MQQSEASELIFIYNVQVSQPKCVRVSKIELIRLVREPKLSCISFLKPEVEEVLVELETR